MLMQLFALIAPHVVSTSTNALRQFQEYMLDVLNLRLNVLFARFSILFNFQQHQEFLTGGLMGCKSGWIS